MEEEEMSVIERPVLNELQARIMEWFICEQPREPIAFAKIQEAFPNVLLPVLVHQLQHLKKLQLIEQKGGIMNPCTLTTRGEICLMDLAPDIGLKLQDALNEALWRSRLPKDDPDYLSLKEHLLERVKQILDEEE